MDLRDKAGTAGPSDGENPDIPENAGSGLIPQIHNYPFPAYTCHFPASEAGIDAALHEVRTGPRREVRAARPSPPASVTISLRASSSRTNGPARQSMSSFSEHLSQKMA